MTSLRRRATAVVASLAVTAAAFAGQVATSAPAAADLDLTASLVYDLGISGANSMVTFQDKLFIPLGDTVQVRDLRGNLVHTITGEPGARSIVISKPDPVTKKQVIYVADRDGTAISRIDPVTETETAHWTVSGCPTSLALWTTYVFYSYGCGSNGIGAIRTGDGSLTDSGVTDSFATPPLLAGGDGLVAAAEPGSSQALEYVQRLDEYGNPIEPPLTPPMSGDEPPVRLGVINTSSPISTMATTDDGQHLAISGPQANQASLWDSSGNAAYVSPPPTDGAVTAVAYANVPIGQELLTGLTGGSSAMQVYDASYTGALLYSTKASSPAASAQLSAVPNTIVLGQDLRGAESTMVYALATDGNSNHDYLEAGLASPLVQPRDFTVSVGSPATYGQPLLVAARFLFRPNVPLILHLVPNSGAPTTVAARTNQWGVAAVQVPVYFSGHVYASYAGDVLTYHETPANSTTANYTAASGTGASMLGGYGQRGGVLYYHSAASIHLHILVAPPHTRSVSVVLQQWTGQVWLPAPKATFTTNQWGALELYLPTAKPGVLYRTDVSTPTTTFNTGSTARSAVFAVG